MTKIILATALVTACSFAQPLSVLRLVRNGSVQPYVDGKATVDVIGLAALSGLSETWLLELHDSFASLEDLDKALSALKPPPVPGQAALSDDLLTPAKTLIGLYRPGFSYRPEQAIQNLAKMRYFDVAIYRVRAGSDAELGKFLKLRRFALDSMNLDAPDIVYQIISGEPAGTYIALTPLPSLKMLDEGRAQAPVYAEGDLATARKAIADTDLVREHLWFRIDPRISYVSDNFASADAGFWHPGAK